jgi:hypothetical protein
MTPEAWIVVSTAIKPDSDDVLESPVVDASCLLIDGFPVNLHEVLPIMLPAP